MCNRLAIVYVHCIVDELFVTPCIVGRDYDLKTIHCSVLFSSVIFVIVYLHVHVYIVVHNYTEMAIKATCTCTTGFCYH